jgi:hypothetical protein
MNDLILYTTEDGRSRIKLRTDRVTVWLTQLEMAELFDATKQNVSLHLKNIFENGELESSATVKESLTVQIGGSREVQRGRSRFTTWTPSWPWDTGCARRCHISPNGALSIQPGATPLDK